MGGGGFGDGAAGRAVCLGDNMTDHPDRDVHFVVDPERPLWDEVTDLAQQYLDARRIDSAAQRRSPNQLGVLMQAALDSREELHEIVSDLRAGFADGIAFTPPPVDLELAASAATRSEIDEAVEMAMLWLPQVLESAGHPGISDGERVDIERLTAARLTQTLSTVFDRTAYQALDAPISTTTRGPYFVGSVDGVPDTIIANVSDDRLAKDLAWSVLFLDIVLEIINLIFAIIGLKLPTPDVEKFSDSFAKLWKSEGFRDAMKRLGDGMNAGEPLAILTFVRYLQSIGVLGEMLAAWLADMSWFDYALAIARFLAWIAAAATTAGAALGAKIAMVLGQAVEFYTKFKQLNDLNTA